MPPHVRAAGRAPSPTSPSPVGVDGNALDVAGRVPVVTVLESLGLFLVDGAAECKGLVGGKGEGEGEGVVKV